MEIWLPIVLIVIGFCVSLLVHYKVGAKLGSAFPIIAAIVFAVLAFIAAPRGRLALIVMAGWMLDNYLWTRKKTVTQ
ncbi:MAG: hypothetical protein ACUVUU_07580 [bacterium]